MKIIFRPILVFTLTPAVSHIDRQSMCFRNGFLLSDTTTRRHCSHPYWMGSWSGRHPASFSGLRTWHCTPSIELLNPVFGQEPINRQGFVPFQHGALAGWVLELMGIVRVGEDIQFGQFRAHNTMARVPLLQGGNLGPIPSVPIMLMVFRSVFLFNLTPWRHHFTGYSVFSARSDIVSRSFSQSLICHEGRFRSAFSVSRFPSSSRVVYAPLYWDDSSTIK